MSMCRCRREQKKEGGSRQGREGRRQRELLRTIWKVIPRWLHEGNVPICWLPRWILSADVFCLAYTLFKTNLNKLSQLKIGEFLQNEKKNRSSIKKSENTCILTVPTCLKDKYLLYPNSSCPFWQDMNFSGPSMSSVLLPIAFG